MNLDNDSDLTLGGTFVLGDAATGHRHHERRTAARAIDGSVQRIINPFTAGQLTTLNNSGLIDMTTGSTSTGDTLTVNGELQRQRRPTRAAKRIGWRRFAQRQTGNQPGDHPGEYQHIASLTSAAQAPLRCKTVSRWCRRSTAPAAPAPPLPWRAGVCRRVRLLPVQGRRHRRHGRKLLPALSHPGWCRRTRSLSCRCLSRFPMNHRCRPTLGQSRFPSTARKCRSTPVLFPAAQQIVQGHARHLSRTHGRSAPTTADRRVTCRLGACLRQQQPPELRRHGEPDAGQFDLGLPEWVPIVYASAMANGRSSAWASSSAIAV